MLSEAVDLLERIGSDSSGAAHAGRSGARSKTPLLDAIADGTFGITRRPADRGKGLDGVAKRAPGYVNPAIEMLEAHVPMR